MSRQKEIVDASHTAVVCRALHAKERPDSEQEALTLETALVALRDAYGALDALAVETGRGTEG